MLAELESKKCHRCGGKMLDADGERADYCINCGGRKYRDKPLRLVGEHQFKRKGEDGQWVRV